jgi:hypothetical protein
MPLRSTVATSIAYPCLPVKGICFILRIFSILTLPMRSTGDRRQHHGFHKSPLVWAFRNHSIKHFSCSVSSAFSRQEHACPRAQQCLPSELDNSSRCRTLEPRRNLSWTAPYAVRSELPTRVQPPGVLAMACIKSTKPSKRRQAETLIAKRDSDVNVIDSLDLRKFQPNTSVRSTTPAVSTL